MKKYDVRIDMARCKGCGLCVLFCPVKKLFTGEKLNKKSIKFVEQNEKKCTGCGLCFKLCPDSVLEIVEVS